MTGKLLKNKNRLLDEFHLQHIRIKVVFRILISFRFLKFCALICSCLYG